MNDRELMKLAAGAAGLYVCSDLEHLGLKEWGPDLWVKEDKFGNYRKWNPLDDDGDALRLAVQLDLLIYSYSAEQKCVAKWSGSGMSVEYWHWNDNQGQGPAMRRAIVRAAAEIGKAIP